MSIHQLIDTILINPTVHVSPSYRDTGLSASYTFKPLSNLVYTRDQQVKLLPSHHQPRPCYCVLTEPVLRIQVGCSLSGDSAFVEA